MKQKIKEFFKKIKEFCGKHKKEIFLVFVALYLCIQVICLLFKNDCKTASAELINSPPPSSCYIVTTYTNPVAYLGNQTMFIYLYAPTFFISSDNVLGISFGSMSFNLSVNNEPTSYLLPFMTNVDSSSEPLTYGGTIDFLVNAQLSSAYSSYYAIFTALESGDITLGYPTYYVSIGGSNVRFEYTFYAKTRDSLSTELFTVIFRRNYLNGGMPTYQTSSASTPFAFTISYVGTSTNSAYNVGYENGYQQGLSDNENSGYSNGYNLGYDSGYSTGYNDGLTANPEDFTPWKILVNGINSFMQIEPIKGVSLSLMFSITFGIVLLGLCIKIFLGG